MTSIWKPLSHVCTWEALGYVASALVLTAFCMKEMIPLRIAALASNLSFIVYAAALGLTPIWLLHLLLLPMNGWRLIQAVHLRRALWQRAERPQPSLTVLAFRRGGAGSFATTRKRSSRSECRAACSGENRTGWMLPDPSSESKIAIPAMEDRSG
jgi:hypothetical protein